MTALTVRPQVGLMLSIGEPPEAGRNYPRKLGHFRPKPGLEQQYADAARRFADAYGPAPKRLDIVLLSDDLGDVLDYRYKAWATDGLRAIGETNFALEPERMLEYRDELRVFPKDKPGSSPHRLDGPDDPVIEASGLKLYGTFRFALPKVTGLTTLAEITTTSKRSMLNLHAGVSQVLNLTGGHVKGIPFELAVRPTRARYFDDKAKQRKTAKFFELVFQTPYTIEEFYEHVAVMRGRIAGGEQRLALPPIAHGDAYRDAELAPGLWRDDDDRQTVEALDELQPLDDGEPPQDVISDERGPVFPIPESARRTLDAERDDE